MSFWMREVFGWLLVAIGLYTMYECLALLKDRAIIEAGPLTVIGVVVFRGGIHLLKVSAAARICREASRAARIERSASVKPSAPRLARGTTPIKKTA